MARNPFDIIKGNNYVARRNSKGRSADVLQVGNGYVVYRVVIDSVPTDTIKVATEMNFRRAYTNDHEGTLRGPRSSKKTIINANPEASAAW